MCLFINHGSSNDSMPFFHFLLLPGDGNKEEKARLSLYPATPNMRCIIGRSAANDSMSFLFFIATC
jgi:hypothetical protein